MGRRFRIQLRGRQSGWRGWGHVAVHWTHRGSSFLSDSNNLRPNKLRRMLCSPVVPPFWKTIGAANASRLNPHRSSPMTIVEATRDYEAWLGKKIPIIKADLVAKHQHMAGDPFSFLRATFYRWMQLWPEHCKDWNNAPIVLGVGDLHVENYGTWRDIEGRLIWGINDFDEAFPMPYTVDLVRLTTSAWLAIELEHLFHRPHGSDGGDPRWICHRVDRGRTSFRSFRATRLVARRRDRQAARPPPCSGKKSPHCRP